MPSEYFYDPYIEEIFLYRGLPVIEIYAAGQVGVFGLRGNYMADFPQYSKEAEEVYEHKLGIRITPRWRTNRSVNFKYVFTKPKEP